MFTSFDKAIAAVVGGLLSAALMAFGLDPNIVSPEAIAAITGLISGALAFVVPNKT